MQKTNYSKIFFWTAGLLSAVVLSGCGYEVRNPKVSSLVRLWRAEGESTQLLLPYANANVLPYFSLTQPPRLYPFKHFEWKQENRQFLLYYQGKKIEFVHVTPRFGDYEAQNAWAGTAWMHEDLPFRNAQNFADYSEIRSWLPQDPHFFWELFEVQELWYPTQSEVIPAYKVLATQHNDPMFKDPGVAWVFWYSQNSKQLIRKYPLQLGMQAQATLYKENKVATPQMTTEVLDNLVNATWLENEDMRVLNCLGLQLKYLTCQMKIRQVGGFFSPPWEAPEYDELVAYYAINSAMNWYKTLFTPEHHKNYSHFGLKVPLDIFVRSWISVAGNLDGAAYNLSHDATKAPYIYMGTGCESKMSNCSQFQFKNLGKDADPFRHEWAHHIIFRSVQNIDMEQSVIVHEALADYFTMAQSGNTCLGESIMKNSNPCLRHAQSTLEIKNMGSASRYVISEFINTILHKIRADVVKKYSDGIVFDKIVFSAIDFLPEDALIYEIPAALLWATLARKSELMIQDDEVLGFIINRFGEKGFFSGTWQGKTTLQPPSQEVLYSANESLSSRVLYKEPITVTYTPEKAHSVVKNQNKGIRIVNSGCGTIARLKKEKTTSAGFIVSNFILLILPAVMLFYGFIKKQTKRLLRFCLNSLQNIRPLE